MKGVSDLLETSLNQGRFGIDHQIIPEIGQQSLIAQPENFPQPSLATISDDRPAELARYGHA